MKARLLRARTGSGAIDMASVDEAAGLLRDGRLVAIPTETVYGLAANALDRAAVARIYAAKGRPSFNPLIVHVPDQSAARRLAAEWPDAAEALAQAFWPGPLTIVVRKQPSVPPEVTAGGDTVALRAPAQPVARALLDALELPLAAPSANRSNAVSPTSAAHVMQGLGARIDAVLDDGPCAVGIESTVVDVTGDVPRLLRPGGLPIEAIERVVGPLARAEEPTGGARRASPGMLTRHYAPDVPTELVDPSAFVAAMSRMPASARVGAVVRTAPRPSDPRVVGWERLGDNPAEFGRRLYASLHRLQDQGATHVLLERVPDAAGWEAVADRLRRAAGPIRR